MNSLKILFVVFSLFVSIVAQCCMNEYRALLDGKLVYKGEFEVVPTGKFNTDHIYDIVYELKKAKGKYFQSRNIEDYSDYGFLLTYFGKYSEAKHVFIDVEKISPNRYQTSANLGTVYELLGQNDSALYWIKNALKINPKSHLGSEWIHEKILEAKIHANGNENYLWENSILGLDFGNEAIPVNKTNLNLDTLYEHIFHQLNERMSFIKPKDPIVGQLLFELGNVCALRFDATSGLDAYNAAINYGYNSEILKKRIVHFKYLQFWADCRNFMDNATYFLIGLFVFGLIFYIIFVFVKFLIKHGKK